MNKKGFTLVEIIVSISLVSVVMIFLFQIITTIKNIYDKQNNKNDTKITVAVITREVEKDLSSFGLAEVPTKTCDMTNNNIVPSTATNVKCIKLIYDGNNVKNNEGYIVYYQNNGKYFLGYKRGKDNIIETQTVREITVAPKEDIDIITKENSDMASLKITLPVRDNNDNYDLVINYMNTDNHATSLEEHIVNYIENLYKNSPSINGLEMDDTKDTNIRYVGANPKNYIYFNEELWRIIGIFNVYNTETKKTEKMVKIVRNDSLGYYSYDTSEENAYGINNWSTSKLQSELNDDYLNNLLTENPYWYNGYNGKKTNQFDRSKVIREEYQHMIGSVRWNLGGSKYADPSDPPYGLPTLEQYNSERGNTVYTRDNITRATTWDGKIGLINASDYGYSSTNEDCRNNLRAGVTYTNSTWDYSGSKCKNNNWLQKTIWYWSLTCSSAKNLCYAIEASGLANYSVASNSGGVFPSLYLLSDVMITSGTGDKNDPYRMD